MSKITYPSFEVKQPDHRKAGKDINQAFQQAVTLQRAGQLPQAEQLCRQILQFHPDHVESLHLLGVIGLQIGQFKPAIEILEKARSHKPGDVNLISTLGMALHQTGELERARYYFEKVVELQPQSEIAHYNLGLNQQACGDFENAEISFRKAIQYKHDYPEAWNNLGSVLQSCNKAEEAVDAYRQALRIRPDFLLAKCNLSSALIYRKELDEARNILEEVVQLQPDYADAWYNMGLVFEAMEQPEKAEQNYKKSLEFNSEQAEVLNTLGLFYYKNNKPRMAQEMFDKALSIKPDYIDALNNKGILLKATGSLDEAIELFDRVVAIRPDYFNTRKNLGHTFDDKGLAAEAMKIYQDILNEGDQDKRLKGRIGNLLQQMGQFSEAEKYFKGVVTEQPDLLVAVSSIVTTKKYTNTDEPEVKHMQDLVAREDIKDQQKIPLYYALGKVFDDCNLYDEAFVYFKKANDLRSTTIDRSRQTATSNICENANYFSKDFFHKYASYGSDSSLPVFVLGMPRSGTTLAEQIISSHPDVFGAGELPFWGNVRNNILPDLLNTTADKYPQYLDTVDEAVADCLVEKCLENLRSYSPDARYVTDKMPHNFIYLGLIGLFFPKAKIFHCNRHPLDVCLSIYMQNFNDNHPYACDLEALGKHYREYRQIMSHWRAVLPNEIYEIQYADIIQDQENASRGMIEFLELDWSEECLQYHKTTRSVKTASLWQVRQPIYTSSSGRWKNYKKYLQPLIDILGTDPD